MDTPISWWTRLQRSISASTAEAEYFSASLASREAVYLRDLLEDIGHGASAPTPMWLDSKAAIDLTADPVAFKKTKHIMRHAYELRDRISRRLFTVAFVPSEDQLADVLTKALRPHDHARLVPRILHTSNATARATALAIHTRIPWCCRRITTFLLALARLFTTLAGRCTSLAPIVSHRRTWSTYLPNCRPPCCSHGSDRPRSPDPAGRHQPPCPSTCAKQQCPGMHVPPSFRRRHLQPADAARDAWPRQLR
jgi:hypothetical protein